MAYFWSGDEGSWRGNGNPEVIEPRIFSNEEVKEVTHISLLTSPTEWKSPEIRSVWENFLRGNINLDIMYQSPAWFDHIEATIPTKVPALAMARTSTGKILGLAPLVRGNFPLSFEIRGRSFWKFSLGAVLIFGEEALFPPCKALYDALFRLIDKAYAQDPCICFFSVPKNSFCWHYLHESAWIKDHFLLYIPGGIRPYHAIDLPATFEKYLEKFNSKKRYNLQRQLKIFEKSGGPLQLQTIQTRDQVPHFLDSARQITQRSWQFARMGTSLLISPQELTDMADRQLLRSYLLMAGDKPCAYVLGYQFQDVYYYEKVGYNQVFSAFSPGTGLLYLIIKDLIENSSARRLNFGYGEAAYKKEFGNIHKEDATIVLLRKTFLNRVRYHAHQAFSSLTRHMKTLLNPRSNHGLGARLANVLFAKSSGAAG